MTTLIGTHQIPCLDDTDYAAYALYMKCVAEQVEDALVANLAKATTALNRPVIMWQVDDTLSNGGGSSTSSASAVSFSHNWPSTFSPLVLATLNRQGWWQIGALCHCVSSAPAVGVGNNRIMSLGIYPPGTPPSLVDFTAGASVALATMQDTTWESNTTVSGEDLFISTNVYSAIDPNTSEDGLGIRLLRGYSVENGGAENVTFTGLMWAIFLGDTPQIQA